MARDFLNLISKDFPNYSPQAKIFNRNNIKVSYSCTSNISQIIKGRNKKIETLHSSTHSNKQCNCRDKETCPLLGNCLQKNSVQNHCKNQQLSQAVQRCNEGYHKTKNIQPQTFLLQQKLHFFIHTYLAPKDMNISRTIT